MYRLLIKQFFRSKTIVLSSIIIMLLGILSIGTGKQFLDQKQIAIQKTIEQQDKHLSRQVDLHKDNIGLLLYYLKFSFIKPLKPIAGIAIGQSDVNSHIQNVKILNLEGQKYDADLVNPMRLQTGNLDLSFVIIFLFPLFIIALNFNVLSQEQEKGTWKMVLLQGRSSLKYLLAKVSIRFLFISLILFILFLLAIIVLNIPLDKRLLHISILSYVYIIFWYTVSFLVIVSGKSSNTNVIVLLTTWLVLVVFLPVLANNYINNKYPVEEAFSMTIEQRDQYHKKWDTDKKATMEKFYNHYSQYRKYKLQEEGFSWLWYYAMQQMGDDESREERALMHQKIQKREALSKTLAQFLPALQVQLAMNLIANTSLADQMDFLEETTNFHEKLRLDFYPKIFDNIHVEKVDWEVYTPEYFMSKNTTDIFRSILPILIIIVLLGIGSFFIGVRKTIILS